MGASLRSPRRQSEAGAGPPLQSEEEGVGPGGASFCREKDSVGTPVAGPEGRGVGVPSPIRSQPLARRRESSSQTLPAPALLWF